MKRDISLYVKDILDAMEKAERFIGAMGREDFPVSRNNRRGHKKYP